MQSARHTSPTLGAMLIIHFLPRHAVSFFFPPPKFQSRSAESTLLVSLRHMVINPRTHSTKNRMGIVMMMNVIVRCVCPPLAYAHGGTETLCLHFLIAILCLILCSVYVPWDRGNIFVGSALLAVPCRILLRRSRLDNLDSRSPSLHQPLSPLCPDSWSQVLRLSYTLSFTHTQLHSCKREQELWVFCMLRKLRNRKSKEKTKHKMDTYPDPGPGPSQHTHTPLSFGTLVYHIGVHNA
jgi:hypothetical protein